jgi:hypothetical protein
VEIFSKIWFTLLQYLWLTGLVLSAYGTGALLVDRCPSATRWPVGVRTILCITNGLGLLLLSFLGLGVAGVFTPAPVCAILIASLFYGLYKIKGVLQAWDQTQPLGLRSIIQQSGGWFWIATLSLIALPFLVKPLQPPLEWDELMYHLPYAKLWAEEGGLTLNPWLRYPLFPYNFNLLYAASLLLGNDVLPHLIHALAATLVTIGLGIAGSHTFGKPVGVLSALLFLASASWGFDTAYIDLGLTLFVSFAFLTLALWFEHQDDTLVVVAAFLFGLAAGTKYQALLFAPIFGFWIIFRTRRPMTYLRVLIAFAIGGAFWYMRNLLVSGDPFHPFGAKVFGYWLWDQADLAALVADIGAHQEWPKLYMLPALLALFFLRGATPIFHALCLSGFAALALWLVTTPGYERYLMPTYPFLALMSAVVIVRLAGKIKLHRVIATISLTIGSRMRSVSLAALLLIISVISFRQTHDYASRIPATREMRDAYLSERLAGYDMFQSLPSDSQWRLYQFGFEGELYYSPVFVVGEVFGPGGYRHVYEMASDPAVLANWIGSLGLNGFILNTSRHPFDKVKFGPNFDDHFELVAETRSARLYRIRVRSDVNG